MAHFGVKQRDPFKKSFSPSRRHSLQTGPVYLANLSLHSFPKFVERFTGLATLPPSLNIHYHYTNSILYSTLFRRPAPIVGYGRHVTDRQYFQTCAGN